MLYTNAKTVIAVLSGFPVFIQKKGSLSFDFIIISINLEGVKS